MLFPINGCCLRFPFRSFSPPQFGSVMAEWSLSSPHSNLKASPWHRHLWSPFLMPFYSSWLSRWSLPIPSFVSHLIKASSPPSSALTWPVLWLFELQQTPGSCFGASRYLCFHDLFHARVFPVLIWRGNLTSTGSVCLGAGHSLLGHYKWTFAIKKLIGCIVSPILSHGNELRSKLSFTEKQWLPEGVLLYFHL